MTTTFFLLRHAAHDNVGGFLAGRTSGIRLGEAGLAQAERLAERMRKERFSSIYASPRERTQQTAEAVARASNIPDVTTVPELDEIAFGDRWQGKTFETLNEDDDWRRWNAVRSLSRTPGGESMLDVQHRAVGLVDRLTAASRDMALVLVSHADVIKSIVGHVLGLPIDNWSRFDIGPASITTLVVGDWGGKLLTLNEVTP